MKLIDLNADGGIGANSLYVQLGDFHLVVDSGLNPKKVGRVAAPNLRPLQGVKLDLIIITHCHLDHIGSLPLLMRAYACCQGSVQACTGTSARSGFRRS